MNKILAIIVNPAVLVFNIVTGIMIGIIKTYKDNLSFFESLKNKQNE